MRILGTNLPEDAWLNPVAVATTGSNILLSGQQTIDGVVVGQYAAGDPRNLRILVKDNTNAVQNGLYDTNTGTWTRCLDANDRTQWAQGVVVFVISGTQNGGTAWQCTSVPTNGIILVGSAALTFASAFRSGSAQTQRAVATSGDLPVKATDQRLNVSTAVALAITIPLASSRAGVPLDIKDIAGTGVGNITINRSGSDTFDGMTSYTFVAAYQRVRLVPANDGVNSGYSFE